MQHISALNQHHSICAKITIMPQHTRGHLYCVEHTTQTSFISPEKTSEKGAQFLPQMFLVKEITSALSNQDHSTALQWVPKSPCPGLHRPSWQVGWTQTPGIPAQHGFTSQQLPCVDQRYTVQGLLHPAISTGHHRQQGLTAQSK